MYRTTLRRTMPPLERDGPIGIDDSTHDRSTKDLALTSAGIERLRRAAKLWASAGKAFEATFGARRAEELCELLPEVVARDLEMLRGKRAALSGLQRAGTPRAWRRDRSLPWQ